MADVIVLGSLNMDLVVRADHIPLPGETIHGEDFTTVPGGKGANQAAAAAQLGASTAMVGRVGADDFGPALLDNMRSRGVDVSHVATDPEAASGIALITVSDSGENTIVVAPGANGRVSLDDLYTLDELLTAARFLVMQFEIPLSVVGAAIARARAADVPVILNPAPAYPVDREFLQGVEYLIVNETEAQTLAVRPVTDLASAEEAGRILLGYGVPTVIVTLGGQGALLLTADADAQVPARSVHIPTRQVEVVDTTAAGDAFVGGFAAGRLKGLDLVESVRYATCAGTLAATVLGAQTSLPTANQVDRFYQEASS